MKGKFSSFRGLIESQRKANPKSWLSFLDKWNLPKMSVTPVVDIVKGYKNYGQPFAADLNQLLVQNVAGFEGENEEEEKGKWANALFNILDWSADTIDTYTNLGESPTDDALEAEDEKNQKEAEEPKGISTTTLLIITGVVVVLFLGTILILKKK